MLRRMRGLAFVLYVVAVGASGCYRSHTRAVRADDAGPADAGAIDTSAPVDAPLACARFVAGESVLLEGHDGVTPRILALDGGEVGVAYVSTDGDPTSVWWERLGSDLSRITGPVSIGTDSWTWAEPARRRGDVLVAYGSTAGAPSRLVRASVDGRVTERSDLPLLHPEVFRETPMGLFWLAFDSGTENAFEIVHVGFDGSLLHPPVRIALGRYGSAFGVAMRPDGTGHVIGYPSEGPPGARRGRVVSVSARGERSEEHTLSDDGADAVSPVFAMGGLRVVYRTDAEIRIATLDPTTLETLAESTLPRRDGSLVVAELAGHFLVGTFLAPELRLVDVASGDEVVARSPRPGFGGSLTWTVVPGALVVALGANDGPRTDPWVVRIECAP